MNLEDALLRGLRSAQPSASAVSEGSLYYVTDELKIEQSRAGVWVAYSGSGAASINQLTGDVTAGPGSGSQAATIPNNIVTYAKMQDVSAADKLLGRGAGSGAGDPQEITLGTNLTMSGTTLNAAGGGGGGGLVYLATRTAANSPTLEFLSLITSTYDVYLFKFTALKSNAFQPLLMQASINNGSSWLTGFSYKQANRWETLLSGSTTGLSGSNNDAFYIFENPISTTGPGISGEVELYDPLTSAYTYAHWDSMGRSTTAETRYSGAGFYEGSNVINAVRFSIAGNILSGSIRMYGYAKT